MRRRLVALHAGGTRHGSPDLMAIQGGTMDRNDPRQAAIHHSEDTRLERAAVSMGEVTGSGRKPYARPRLTEHGRVPALTLPPSTISDRNAKEGFEPVDPRAVLAAVARLPIERWSYKGETVRHLGPMAQDFTAAFGLGADDRHIFTLDAAGVALAAIQGLHRLAQAQQVRLEALERELTALRRETTTLRAELVLREAEPIV
jgi:endosialidase-like protein